MDVGARRGRGGWLLLLPMAVLVGCEDVGLPGRNTPQQEHANRAWRYVVYDEGVKPAGTSEAMVHFQVAADAGQTVDIGRHYLPSAETVEIPQTLLRPVAGMGGPQLYALTTDNPPYQRLFTPAATPPLHPGGMRSFHVMQQVPEPAMRHEAESEDHSTMDHGTGR